MLADIAVLDHLRKYFDKMDISEERKKEREGLAERLYDIFSEVFLILKLLDWSEGNQDSIEAYLFTWLLYRYEDVLDDFGYEHPGLAIAVGEIVHTTVEFKEEWYTSTDRAIFVAENETNTVINNDEYLKAVKKGYTTKTWKTMLDSKVRKSHITLQDKTIPINDLFNVNGSKMRYPMDMQYNPEPEEVINCRCSLHYQ